MRPWFPFSLMLVSILTVVAGNVVLFQPSVLHYLASVANDSMRAFLFNGVAVVTFLPVVSLVTAILVRSVKHRAVTVEVSSLWLVYWLGILTFYTVTKGR